MGVNPVVGIRTRAPSGAERHLLLSALGVGTAPPDAEGPTGSGIDWEFLVAYAHERCALPALSDYVARCPRPSAIPGGPLAALEDAALRNELQNRVLLRDLADIVKVLQGAGIPSIAIKGAALVASHPRLLRLRHTDDIDLWVPEEHLATAQERLRREGLRDFGFILTPDDDRRHQLQMLVTERGTPVEIHRRPPDGLHEAFRDAWSVADTIDVHGVQVAVRAGPQMLLDLCAHVALHHHADPQLWPRHVVDCTTLLAARPTIFDEASAHADLAKRAALWLSRAVLTQAERRRGGPLADRLVFPIRPGWRAYYLGHSLLQTGCDAPERLHRLLWPSQTELKARGYESDRPWQAHWKRIRAHIDAVRLP